RRVIVGRAAEAIAIADSEAWLVVEEVEPLQRSDADTVDPARVARDGGSEPADAQRPASHRPELVAAFADLVADFVGQLGRERPISHARRVGLEYADGQIDLRRRDAAAGQRAARRRVGAGDVRIRAEVQ